MEREPSELTLDPGPVAVPHARRFAVQALGGVDPDLADSVRLVVTELVANAVLHGAPPITLRLRPSAGGGVRVEVRDRGPRMPLRVPDAGTAMTGRGLSLVAALASRWGSERDGTAGKVVWADLGTPVPAAPDPVDLPASGEEPSAEPHYDVDLGEVPTDLLIAAKGHVDNVVRELTLAAGPLGSAAPATIEQLAHLVTRDFRSARAQIKEQAVRAAHDGQPLTHLRLRLPPSAADAAERYLAALDEADRYARAARLLTTETPPVHRVFRRWYIETVAGSLRRQAAGGPPGPPATTFLQRLADEYTTVAGLRETARRLSLLQKVTADLAAAATVQEVADAIVTDAHAMLDATTAVVYLLGDDQVVREISRHGTEDAVLAHSYEQFPLEAHVPGAVALRTGASMVFRNRAELLEHFPKLAGRYPHETRLAVAPLAVGAHRLGVLALIFPGGAVGDDEELRSLVSTLAGVAAQAMERARAASASTDAAAKLAFLAEASVLLASSVDYREVLRAVANLVVPRLADWCAIQLLEGEALRTVALTHFDEGRAAWALQMQDRYPTDMSAATGAPQVIRTGRSELYQDIPATLLDQAALDTDHRRMLETLGLSSALVVPLTGRTGIIGALTMIQAESGRHYTPDDVSVAEDLARRAALAVETAHAFREQSGRLAALARVAEVAQRAILAPPPAQLGTVGLAARYVSAAAEALVGGDLYETVHRSGAVRLLIGDVRGKGLEAVRVATIVLGEFRSAAADVDDLADVATQLDRRLRGYLGEEDFVTAVLAEIGDDGSFTVVSCGHPAPLLRAGGQTSQIPATATLPLGLGVEPVAVRGQLHPGDRLLLVTDGLLEARDGRGRFVDPMTVTATLARGSLDDALDGILSALRTATGGTLGDDLALLLAEYRGPASEGPPAPPPPRAAEPEPVLPSAPATP